MVHQVCCSNSELIQAQLIIINVEEIKLLIIYLPISEHSEETSAAPSLKSQVLAVLVIVSLSSFFL
jgi:hypothetical protein